MPNTGPPAPVPAPAPAGVTLHSTDHFCTHRGFVFQQFRDTNSGDHYAIEPSATLITPNADDLGRCCVRRDYPSSTNPTPVNCETLGGERCIVS